MAKERWKAPFDPKWYGKPQPKPESIMKVTVNTCCSKCGRGNGRRSITVKKNISKKDFLEKFAKMEAILNIKCRWCNGKLKIVN